MQVSLNLPVFFIIYLLLFLFLEKSGIATTSFPLIKLWFYNPTPNLESNHKILNSNLNSLNCSEVKKKKNGSGISLVVEQ